MPESVILAMSNLNKFLLTLFSPFFFTFSNLSMLTITITFKILPVLGEILSVPGIQKDSKYSFIENSPSLFSPILAKLKSRSTSFYPLFLNWILNFCASETGFSSIGILFCLVIVSQTCLQKKRSGGSITTHNITFILFVFTDSFKYIFTTKFFDFFDSKPLQSLNTLEL